MKTSELVSGLKEIGYLVDREERGHNSEYLAISTADGYLIATVSEKYYGVLDTDIYKGYNEKQEHNPIFRMLIKYAMTPLDKREDTKKYVVKMLPEGDNYVNQDNYDKHIFFSNKSETDRCKTHFTEKEYDEVQKQNATWLPVFDTKNPHFVEVQDDTTKKGEPMTKLHDSELMYPDEEFTRTY